MSNELNTFYTITYNVIDIWLGGMVVVAVAIIFYLLLSRRNFKTNQDESTEQLDQQHYYPED